MEQICQLSYRDFSVYIRQLAGVEERFHAFQTQITSNSNPSESSVVVSDQNQFSYSFTYKKITLVDWVAIQRDIYAEFEEMIRTAKV